ncbi:NAD-dependent deacylase [Dactylosporangium sp. NPDC050588]|uniref:SIR2 family NAD-dependent protein deacylase n=1 Tax=Dactylosporangium sp. NPDC050588 TaxID=3157211 RepID=UPI0033C2E270
MQRVLPDGVAERIATAGRVVVFTGAGISAESGVPTFRDALTGLWSRFDAYELATPEAFEADPALVWGWYEWRRAAVRRAEPNAGHVAAAALQSLVPGTVVVTQNVDDLHERAGSKDPVHLHGSLFAPRCVAGHPFDAPPGDDDVPDDLGPVPPPRCTACGALVRPGVVWFGEALPRAAFAAAVEAASSCDVLLSIGTSGVVYPAAELPVVATRSGATVIQVNPDETPLDDICDVNLRGTAARLLPAIYAEVKEVTAGGR